MSQRAVVVRVFAAALLAAAPAGVRAAGPAAAGEAGARIGGEARAQVGARIGGEARAQAGAQAGGSTAPAGGSTAQAGADTRPQAPPAPYAPPPGAPATPPGSAPIPPHVESAPVPAAGAGGGYCYAGPHPVDTRVAAGAPWDESHGRHIHFYPPFDLRLFAYSDGCYHFIGDPTDFGYRGTTYAYYGAHPVHDVHGGGWCFIIGGHAHWWRPWHASFVYVGPWYYWHGPYDDFFWSYWPYWAFYYHHHYPHHYRGGRFYRERSAHVAPPIRSVPAPPANAEVWRASPPGSPSTATSGSTWTGRAAGVPDDWGGRGARSWGSAPLPAPPTTGATAVPEPRPLDGRGRFNTYDSAGNWGGLSNDDLWRNRPTPTPAPSPRPGWGGWGGGTFDGGSSRGWGRPYGGGGTYDGGSFRGGSGGGSFGGGRVAPPSGGGGYGDALRGAPPAGSPPSGGGGGRGLRRIGD